MVLEDPNLDVADVEEKSYLSWLIIAGVVILTAVVATWLIRSNRQHDAVVSALQQQMEPEKLVLDQERDKVFELTRKLETLKQQINGGQVPNKAAAIAEYNALAAEQRKTREKVKTLADSYNQKVAKLHEVQ